MHTVIDIMTSYTWSLCSFVWLNVFACIILFSSYPYFPYTRRNLFLQKAGDFYLFGAEICFRIRINNQLKCIYFTSHRWYTFTYRCWYSRGELSFVLTILLVSFIFEIFWYATTVDQWLSWDLLWSRSINICHSWNWPDRHTTEKC